MSHHLCMCFIFRHFTCTIGALVDVLEKVISDNFINRPPCNTVNFEINLSVTRELQLDINSS